MQFNVWSTAVIATDYGDRSHYCEFVKIGSSCVLSSFHWQLRLTRLPLGRLLPPMLVRQILVYEYRYTHWTSCAVGINYFTITACTSCLLVPMNAAQLTVSLCSYVLYVNSKYYNYQQSCDHNTITMPSCETCFITRTLRIHNVLNISQCIRHGSRAYFYNHQHTLYNWLCRGYKQTSFDVASTAATNTCTRRLRFSSSIGVWDDVYYDNLYSSCQCPA